MPPSGDGYVPESRVWCSRWRRPPSAPSPRAGNATLVEILGHQVFGTRPQHSSDQLDMYDDLVHHYDNLTEDRLDAFTPVSLTATMMEDEAAVTPAEEAHPGDEHCDAGDPLAEPSHVPARVPVLRR